MPANVVWINFVFIFSNSLGVLCLPYPLNALRGYLHDFIIGVFKVYAFKHFNAWKRMLQHKFNERLTSLKVNLNVSIVVATSRLTNYLFSSLRHFDRNSLQLLLLYFTLVMLTSHAINSVDFPLSIKIYASKCLIKEMCEKTFGKVNSTNFITIQILS